MPTDTDVPAADLPTLLDASKAAMKVIRLKNAGLRVPDELYWLIEPLSKPEVCPKYMQVWSGLNEYQRTKHWAVWSDRWGGHCLDTAGYDSVNDFGEAFRRRTQAVAKEFEWKVYSEEDMAKFSTDESKVSIGGVAPLACPKCGAKMKWRKSSYGIFMGCEKFPDCDGKLKASAMPQAPQTSNVGTGEGAQPPEENSGGQGPGMVAETPAKPGEGQGKPSKPAKPGQGQGQAQAQQGEGKPDAKSEAQRKAELKQQAEQLREQLKGIIEQEVAKEAAKQIKPKEISWKVNDKPFAQVDGDHHYALEEVLRRVKAGIRNILLVGPAGSGKTHLASDVAKALGAKFTSVSCTGGMPEWHIVGRSMPSLTTGQSIYQASEFINAYEGADGYVQGGIALLDEIDAADPNTLLAMNSAIANGYMSLPSRVENQRALRAPKFILIAAANTYGVGASRQYVGRNQLDAATLSRFACAVIDIDYDERLEKQLVPEDDIRKRVQLIRKQVKDASLRRVVGTRELLAVASLVRSGESLAWAIGAMTVGWTPDELERAGVE